LAFYLSKHLEVLLHRFTLKYYTYSTLIYERGLFFSQFDDKEHLPIRKKLSWIELANSPNPIELDWASTIAARAKSDFGEVNVKVVLQVFLTGLVSNTWGFKRFQMDFSSKLRKKVASNSRLIDDVVNINNEFIGDLCNVPI
jgi:hypothetical protein